MPADVVKRINVELNLILKEQDTRDQLTRLITRPTPGTPEDFSKQLVTDIARWSRVVKDANIKVE
jgi:tripartite-type tricarboxylate transporter receptor subunit TctC